MRNLVLFAGGLRGQWRVTAMTAIRGDGLPNVERVEMVEAGAQHPGDPSWCLRGLVSNARYANRREVDALAAVQPALARPTATCAALIPIRKSAAWWSLAQDERRAIFEETSRHTEIGMGYLPAVARRLHHSRDLDEPFDFLTWFEFAPKDESRFDDLVAKLRRTPEWEFVEREVDIRLCRPQLSLP